MYSSNPNRLVISNRPVLGWMIGAIFMATGLFLALSQASLIMALIFGGFGLLAFLAGGFGSRLELDKKDGAARLIRYSIAGKQVSEYLLSEISTAEVARSVDGEGSRTYHIELVLKNGERLPLTGYSSSGLVSKQLQADKIRSFLGAQEPAQRAAAVLGVSPQVMERLGVEMYRAQPVESAGEALERGLTDGVSWEIQRLTSAGGGQVTRWFSAGARTAGGFIMLVQGGRSQPGKKGLGGLLGSLSQLLYRQYIGMYQISPDEVPGLEQAQPVQNLDPRLASAFISLTDDSFGARQVLNPWVVAPLADWAGRHPAGGVQLMRPNTFGPLFVLFSPRGVTMAFASLIDQPALVEEITRLGVELVKANSNF